MQNVLEFFTGPPKFFNQSQAICFQIFVPPSKSLAIPDLFNLLIVIMSECYQFICVPKKALSVLQLLNQDFFSVSFKAWKN
jgi:hypothetical protein